MNKWQNKLYYHIHYSITYLHPKAYVSVGPDRTTSGVVISICDVICGCLHCAKQLLYIPKTHRLDCVGLRGCVCTYVCHFPHSVTTQHNNTYIKKAKSRKLYSTSQPNAE